VRKIPSYCVFIILCFLSLYFYSPATSKAKVDFVLEEQCLYSDGEILERTGEVQKELEQIQKDLKEYRRKRKK